MEQQREPSGGGRRGPRRPSPDGDRDRSFFHNKDKSAYFVAGGGEERQRHGEGGADRQHVLGQLFNALERVEKAATRPRDGSVPANDQPFPTSSNGPSSSYRKPVFRPIAVYTCWRVILLVGLILASCLLGSAVLASIAVDGGRLAGLIDEALEIAREGEWIRVASGCVVEERFLEGGICSVTLSLSDPNPPHARLISRIRCFDLVKAGEDLQGKSQCVVWFGQRCETIPIGLDMTPPACYVHRGDPLNSVRFNANSTGAARDEALEVTLEEGQFAVWIRAARLLYVATGAWVLLMLLALCDVCGDWRRRKTASALAADAGESPRYMSDEEDGFGQPPRFERDVDPPSRGRYQDEQQVPLRDPGSGRRRPPGPY